MWSDYHLKKPGAKFWAEICCPDCGKVSLVGRNHDVAAGGVASPSFVCLYLPCTWHVFVRLADWDRPGPPTPWHGLTRAMP
jgi:hypothetical protein